MRKMINETFEMKQRVSNDLLKSWNQSTGLINYDLQRPAKLIYPVITKLRNMIPRVRGNGDIMTHWKVITAINSTNVNAGVSEGNRGGIISTVLADKSARYKGVGLEDSVTYEAEYAAEGFDDVLARAVQGLLASLMVQEEKIIIGANNSVALGTTPTPVLAGSTTGGTLSTGTLSVICVALTYDGFITGKVTTGILQQVTRNNADGSTDIFGGYSAQKSSAASVSITGPTGSATATVTPVNGAIAYAWFWGTSGSEKIGAITTINSVSITEDATGTQTAVSLAAADYSKNDLLYDGVISQIFEPLSGSYIYTMPTGTPGIGTQLTPDGHGGIAEIETALKAFWNNYNLGPDLMLVNAQELDSIGKVLFSNASGSILRYNLNANDNTGGTAVKYYTNKYNMSGLNRIEIMNHAFVPPGTIIFMSSSLPETYKYSNVGNLLEMRTRRDYYQKNWPQINRKYQYGVYADEVLINYFQPAFGVITNIASG